MTSHPRMITSRRVPARRAAAQMGISLVIVLILIGAMALASAASLRASAGSLQLLRVRSMQALALEQAQFALQYCESQLRLASAARNPALADAALPLPSPQAMAWPLAANWQSGAISVPPVLSAPSAPGSTPASCLVERQVLGGSHGDVPIYVVTARGLSPDHSADASTGATRSGAAAWLQSTVLIAEGQVRARSHRRIVNPPLR
jgi:hypothetical protein